MKTPQILLSFATIIVIASGCSSGPFASSESGKDIAQTGPTVLNARSEPGTIELNRDLKTNTPAEILADVKDFQSKISDVRLQFLSVPLEIAMQNIGGTTWRAQLNPEQLQMLAVSGKTIKYDANIIARDIDGHSNMAKSPIQVAIKAPDLSKNVG